MKSYKTKGTCSSEIRFDVQNKIITDIEFISGCPGNLIGIQSLVKGQEVEKVIDRLKGIRCGSKSTSCPDQLALALEEFASR